MITSVTLQLRRHLEHALFPVEQIGSLVSPGCGESHAAFVLRMKVKRAAHLEHNQRLFKRLQIDSPQQVRDKIAELKNLETVLGSQCRPDLYPL